MSENDNKKIEDSNNHEPPMDNGGKPIAKDGSDLPTPEPKTGMTDAEAKLLKEVMEKKALIKEQGEEIKKFKEMASALEALGGLDAFKSMVEDRKAEELKKAEAKGEWEKLKAQMAEEHAKATEGYKTQIAELQSKLKTEESKIAELTVGAAFSNSEYLKSKTVLTPSKARIIYGDYFDIAEDGTVQAFDKPRGTSGRTALVDQMGNGLGFEAAIEKIMMADPDHDSLMRAKGANGAGSSSTGTRSPFESTKTEPKKSGLDMIAAGISSIK